MQQHQQQKPKQKKTTTEPVLNGLGHVPPNASELEEAVLGAMILEKASCQIGLSLISTEEIFYKESHQIVFKAIRGLVERYAPVDLLTVTNELRVNGYLESVGGAFWLTGLLKANSGEHMEFHINVIREKWIRRQIIRASALNHKFAFDETTDVFTLLEKAQNEINAALDDLSVKKACTLRVGMLDALKSIRNSMGMDGGITGIPSGLTDLDRLTGGWQKSDLIIMAGRPGMGKTTTALQCAVNAAEQYGKKVAVFSLEMSTRQLCVKIVSQKSQMASTSQLRKGQITLDQMAAIEQSVSEVLDAGLYIDDTGGLSVQQLVAKVKVLYYEHGIDMVMIDYLQLLSVAAFSGQRERELGIISGMLKTMAKELDIPVIALSQLSRSVESRGGDKKPQLSDLRESGAIEQDADMVIFTWRPEYYKFEADENGNSWKDRMVLLVAKHRNGACLDIEVSCKMKYSRVYDSEAAGFTESKQISQTPQQQALPEVKDLFNKNSGLKGVSVNDFDDKAPF